MFSYLRRPVLVVVGLFVGCLMLVLGTAAAAVLPASASAGKVFQETFHDEDAFVLGNFCDVAGLTVELTATTDGSIHAVQHGTGEAPYFIEHATRREVYTNPANGKSVTGLVRGISKDLRITDNGDGTITILVLATGNAVLYGEDGQAIFRDPGQIRFEILIDVAGTPSDPSDDEFLAFLGVLKESTGRNDDFCAAAVAALR